MYVIREVLYCQPGKVRPLVEKFRAMSAIAEKHGYSSMRLLTDVSGERFWTVVLENQAETLDGFFEMEQKIMSDEEARGAMAGYHDLVAQGRREIFRLES